MKKAVLVTDDLALYNKCCKKLEENNILYSVKCTDEGNTWFNIFPSAMFGGSRRSRGTIFENEVRKKRYYIKVKSQDYEKAKYFINKN